MKSNPTRFWWTVIALGWVFDFLFWEKGAGINFAIYVALCVGTGYLLLRLDGQAPAKQTSWLLLPMALTLIITVIRREPMTVFLAYVTTLTIMVVFTLTYTGGRWLQYSMLDYLGGFFRLLGSMIASPLGFSAEIKRKVAEKGEQDEVRKRGASQVWPVVRGILIALPIVAIFAGLLASADLIFQQRLEAFIELFNIENLPEYLFRMFYILIFAYALAGVYLHAASKSSDEKLIGEEKPLTPAFLGFVEASIVLGSVVALFTIFVIIQFQYFFGGQANISIEGYTYSEYARRGFGELVTVAFFSLLLLLGLSGITQRKGRTRRQAFSVLGIALVSLVIVMLASAFDRLLLYESAYGFSRLRTYTHVFILWLGALLVAVILLEILERQRAFALAAVLASLGFVLSLGFMNVDGFIVKQNVKRAVESAEASVSQTGRAAFDSSYLSDLSLDAVPALAKAYQTQPLPASVKDGVGAALKCYQVGLTDKEPYPWQAFHLSRWTAERILRSLESDLAKYQLDDEVEWLDVVITPLGEEYHCAIFFWD
ncbi:MAG: DUF4173 domain-containing protein [Anaerolineales bacterium]